MRPHTKPLNATNPDNPKPSGGNYIVRGRARANSVDYRFGVSSQSCVLAETSRFISRYKGRVRERGGFGQTTSMDSSRWRVVAYILSATGGSIGVENESHVADRIAFPHSRTPPTVRERHSAVPTCPSDSLLGNRMVDDTRQADVSIPVAWMSWQVEEEVPPPRQEWQRTSHFGAHQRGAARFD